MSAGEKSTRAVIHGLLNLDVEPMKKFAGLIEHLRADVEGMMQAAVLLDGSNDRVFTLAENDIVAANAKTGLRRVGKSADMFQPENLAVKLLRSSRLFTGIDQ